MGYFKTDFRISGLPPRERSSETEEIDTFFLELTYNY